MRTFLRFQNWLAGHVRAVQYPRQQYIPAGIRRPLFAWKYQMPLPMRMGLILLGLGGMFFAMVAAVALLVLGWAFLGAIIGAH